MHGRKKALVGVLAGLLPLISIVLGDFCEGYDDVMFLTSFLIYALLLPWTVEEQSEKTILLLAGSMALMAPAMGTLLYQPGIVAITDDSVGLSFSTPDYLLVSASGVAYYTALSRISQKTGTTAFRVQGLSYLIATVGSVTPLGILGFLGWIFGVPVSHFIHYRRHETD